MILFICKLYEDRSCFDNILRETEKSAQKLNLDRKQSLHLRLLAEELCGMLPELLDKCQGEFLLEHNGKDFEMHVLAGLDGIDKSSRDRLLSVSRSGRNSAAVGFMGSIRAAAENLLAYMLQPEAPTVGNTFGELSYTETAINNKAWSLSEYKRISKTMSESHRSSKWDELEKSIVAKLADDVTVGIKGDKVEICLTKSF